MSSSDAQAGRGTSPEPWEQMTGSTQDECDRHYAEAGRTLSSDDPLIPVPRALLREVATYLYRQGEDMLREQVERYAWDEGPQTDEPLSPEFQARLEAAVERGQEARRNDRASLGLADPHGFIGRDQR